MKSSDYKQLIVWHKAMDLVVEVYSIVKLLPKEELYALSDQMRRAVVSIPSNIAEGLGRNSDKEFVQFLSISRGSLWELETQIEVCERLNYVDVTKTSQTKKLITEISKMLNSLANSLTKK
ncbi:MAG: four helix bundle protein [Bacteroidales bacterium]|nr:four helix bundle protein [Bacteroidales bacterium]